MSNILMHLKKIRAKIAANNIEKINVTKVFKLLEDDEKNLKIIDLIKYKRHFNPKERGVV